MYGCETLSVTLREDHRLRVFENWMLRRIFGPKREEVTQETEKKCIIRRFILYCIVLYLLLIPAHPYKAEAIGYRTCHTI
jgi:hypothetical protein